MCKCWRRTSAKISKWRIPCKWFGASYRVSERLQNRCKIQLRCSCSCMLPLSIYSPPGLLQQSSHNFITNTSPCFQYKKKCTLGIPTQPYRISRLRSWQFKGSRKRRWWQSECHFVSVPTSDFEPLSETEFPWFFSLAPSDIQLQFGQYPAVDYEVVEIGSEWSLTFFFVAMIVVQLVGKILKSVCVCMANYTN